MNFIIIMTDTQNKSMIGAYGNENVHTPNLDQLAKEGIRFENAYTTCPLCTPARSGIFTGQYPQINGAICNNVAPSGQVSHMGKIFRKFGYRAGYTGKWHLDGSAYFGDGVPGGGFEEDWWYDGKCYAEDIGEDLFKHYLTGKTADDLRVRNFAEDKIWGHRVADKAINFLESIQDEPFVLVCSFDEPHDPFVAPPEYWEQFKGTEYPMRPNFNASIKDKPELAQIQRSENGEISWEDYAASEKVKKWYGCNSYIDKEIGRVLDKVKDLHEKDTMIIYTSDHGDQDRSHGLISKGPMMYEESTNIPFIVRMPDSMDLPKGVVTNSIISHLDIIPTMLDYAGLEQPECLNGISMKALLENPLERIRTASMISYHRFAINHDSFGEFYPIRSAVDENYKLVINLHDSDEFYDLINDPYEMKNLIDNKNFSHERNRLHDWILSEMNRIRDPYRGWLWGSRKWRSVKTPFYHDGPKRAKPKGFYFESTAREG